MNFDNKSSWLLANKKTVWPIQISCAGENFFCAHTGTSMNPTLSRQDLLEIIPLHNKTPKIGDVVIFQPPQHDSYFVHRIIRAEPGGFHTRGDNNNGIDPWVLSNNEIFGRVIGAYQGEKQRKIAGGCLGRLTGCSCLVRRKIEALLCKLLGPVYRSFCPGGLFHRLIPVRLRVRVATFQSEQNASHKLLLGRYTIGSYDENRLRWQIRRPFRIFIDDSSLPTPQ